jgi:DNA-binding response OmpR family regulator
MRILVVEDEHKIANSIKKGLEQEAFAVDVAYDGQSGFDLAVGEKYDAIVLDLMLPGMDGIEICKKLRQDKIHVPILMLTAKSQIEDRVAGLNTGADDYLVKPFAFAELVARLRALLRRPGQVLPQELKVGDLTLNTGSFEVNRANRRIDLSRKEFSLLEFLIRHTEQILTKEQIIEGVWSYDADILPNTVEVYMKNLRAKVDEPFAKSQNLLQTVRGFGYKISEKG